MELKYFEEARKNKCLIVSACGFDSIPSEMGVVMLQDGARRTANGLASDNIEECVIFDQEIVAILWTLPIESWLHGVALYHSDIQL